MIEILSPGSLISFLVEIDLRRNTPKSISTGDIFYSINGVEFQSNCENSTKYRSSFYWSPKSIKLLSIIMNLSLEHTFIVVKNLCDWHKFYKRKIKIWGLPCLDESNLNSWFLTLRISFED